MRDFLKGEHGVARRGFDEFYELRCNVAHGGSAFDPDGVDATSGKADRIEQLLMEAIKKRLGWPQDKPPTLVLEGYILGGAAALDIRANCYGFSRWELVRVTSGFPLITQRSLVEIHPLIPWLRLGGV